MFDFLQIPSFFDTSKEGLKDLTYIKNNKDLTPHFK